MDHNLTTTRLGHMAQTKANGWGKESALLLPSTYKHKLDKVKHGKGKLSATPCKVSSHHVTYAMDTNTRQAFSSLCSHHANIAMQGNKEKWRSRPPTAQTYHSHSPTRQKLMAHYLDIM